MRERAFPTVQLLDESILMLVSITGPEDNQSPAQFLNKNSFVLHSTLMSVPHRPPASPFEPRPGLKTSRGSRGERRTYVATLDLVVQPTVMLLNLIAFEFGPGREKGSRPCLPYG